MGEMDFEWNEAGMKDRLRQVADRISAADERFRQTHAGLPFSVVRADAPRFLAEGVELPDKDLDRYAQAVADGEPFEFRLVGE